MQDNSIFFSKVFMAFMLFTGLVWIWTVVFIISWPWEKTAPKWQPEFRLVATCTATKQTCGISYGELAEARAKGLISAIEPAIPAGDIEEPTNWLTWKKENGFYEVKASSWNFQSTIRYRIENNSPILIAYQDVNAKAFYYGLAAGLFTLIGIYLRKLRR